MTTQIRTEELSYFFVTHAFQCKLRRVQLNLFLSRLYGEPVGFTVIGIFVIDKNTILTVGGYQKKLCICYHQLSCSQVYNVIQKDT